MYKELRSVVKNSGGSNSYEGIRVSTPEAWARNFASSKKPTIFRKIKLRVDKRYQLIRKYFKPGGKILDAGCGFGEWVNYLNARGFDAAGLDYSETLINRVNSAYPAIEWLYGRIENIPAANSTYDGVISWGVIEHNEDGPHAALAEFYRVLKPGGHAIVTVPFEDMLAVNASKLDFEPDEGEQSRVFFQYYMTKKDLAEHMLQSRFEVLEVGLCPPASLGKVLPKVYAGLNKFPKIRLLLIHLFGAIFFWKSEWHFMMYCVGRKPE
jgi:ubiquinone/menaquinone biosynthesis C-methylase UbiE